VNNTPSEFKEFKKRRHHSIVVVGNETPALLSLSLLLQRFAYDVVVANTATQALERISAVRPALVITDTVLAGMGGMDLFERLREDKRTSSIPVIFMVSPGDAATESRCLDMGAAGCVTKPVQAEELYQTVQQVIEPRPRANIRIDALLPVTVNNMPLDCPRGACEVDLSERGMYVTTQKPFPANRRISMKIGIKDRTISAEGTVLYSNLAVAAGPGMHREPGMGLKFVSIAPQDREFIRTFIRDEVTRDIDGKLSPEPADVW